MDALNLLPTHPRWGTALGLRRNGEPIWPYRGGSEPVDDGTQGGTGGDGTTGQGAGTASTDQNATDDGTQSGTGDDGGKVDRAEYERVKNQLQANDRKASDLEQKLKAIEDSKKDELTKATERAEELNQRVSVLEQENTQLKLEKSMLSDPEYGADKWQDPEEVLDKLNRAVKDEVVIVKDGEVDRDSVKKFLKDLASKKGYLLKTSAGSAVGGKSGSAVGNGDRRGKDGEMTDDELKRRYRIR